jgi:hypothetical protein
MSRALVGIAGFLIFGLIALSGRETALTLALVWLVLLGFIRRLLIPFVGWSPNDPLLLVGPASAAVIWFFSRGTTPVRQSLVRALVGPLLLWVVAQLLNPNEPSLAVAAQGALFYVGPLLWFFVGLHLDRAQHDRVLSTLFWMSLVVVAHGLYQTFVDLLPFEYTWLGASGQGAAVYVGGFNVRPFSTLVSPQEYGVFLSIALMIIWARFLHRRAHRGWLLLYWIVTAVALFYQSSRGIFLFFLIGQAVVTVAHWRSAAAFLAVVVLGAGLALFAGTQQISAEPDDPGAGAGRSSALVRHQLSGLTNPGDSTAGLHVELAAGALDAALDHPLGLGVSTATLASRKAVGFEGQRIKSAENDFGNVPAALGLPGGLAYIAIVVATFAGAVQIQRRRPSARHLAWLGILAVTTAQWMNGSLYTVSAIVWLAVGGIARETAALAGGLDDPGDPGDRGFGPGVSGAVS